MKNQLMVRVEQRHAGQSMKRWVPEKKPDEPKDKLYSYLTQVFLTNFKFANAEIVSSYFYDKVHKDISNLESKHVNDIRKLLTSFILLDYCKLESKQDISKLLQLYSPRIPIPTSFESMLIDLVEKNGKLILSFFSTISEDILHRKDKMAIVSKLKELQTIFGIAKMPFDQKTLNYEIYDEIQTYLINLITAIQNNNDDEAKEFIEGIKEIFVTIVNTKREIEYTGAKMPTLVDTGDKIGGIRIFSVKN